jgi:two-component system, NarL family, response regulator NreC
VSTQSPSDLSLVLVDSRVVMREALRILLEQQPDLKVLAQASTVQETAKMTISPDVVITDIEMPDARGPEVVRVLGQRFANSAILILTMVTQPARVQRVLTAGAAGYVLRTATPADLLTAVRSVAGGSTYLEPSLGVALARWQGPAAGADVRVRRLPPRAEEVLRLLALGHTNAEAARLAGMGLRTVEAHRSRILETLGLTTRAELVRYAQSTGLMDPED